MDTWTAQAELLTCLLQYPLIVGVVVAVTTGLEKGMWTSGTWMPQSLRSSSGCREKMHFVTTVDLVLKGLRFSQRKMGCFMTATGFWDVTTNLQIISALRGLSGYDWLSLHLFKTSGAKKSLEKTSCAHGLWCACKICCVFISYFILHIHAGL